MRSPHIQKDFLFSTFLIISVKQDRDYVNVHEKTRVSLGINVGGSYNRLLRSKVKHTCVFSSNININEH